MKVNCHKNHSGNMEKFMQKKDHMKFKNSENHIP